MLRPAFCGTASPTGPAPEIEGLDEAREFPGVKKALHFTFTCPASNENRYGVLATNGNGGVNRSPAGGTFLKGHGCAVAGDWATVGVAVVRMESGRSWL